MASLQYYYISSTPGPKAFTMPKGFQANVEVHCWGAGGGDGTGGVGGGGGYVKSLVTINPGDIVEIGVGLQGAAASGQSAGAGGGSSIGFSYAGGSGGGSGDEDADMGAGGGGGGATVVEVNGIPVAVAAGGGGGGGNGDDGGAGGAGLPGGVQASATGWYPVSLSWAWNSFMNSYAIWTGGSQDVTTNVYTTIVNFPTSGTYTFNLSTDNYGSLTLDSTLIISYSDFTTTGTTTHAVTAGNHTITLSITNQGGPAGIAAQILNPDSSELWDTRNPQNFPQLNSTTQGAAGAYGSAGGGGGGGGVFGGLGGTATGDDQGGAPGGSGGLQLGDTKLPGSGEFAGGRTTTYAPTAPYGNAGYGGYAILVLTRRFQLWNKVTGAWNQITNAWQKVNGQWQSISQIYIKNNGAWNPLLSTTVINDKRSVQYTTQGTYSWICPADIIRVKARVYGAGGAGTGGAGGAGGYAEKYLTVTPGATYTAVVGAGTSATGQDSSFNSTIIAHGGGAGASQTGGTDAGGSGGTATGGDTNLTGAAGTSGQAVYSYYYWWWGWGGWGWNGYYNGYWNGYYGNAYYNNGYYGYGYYNYGWGWGGYWNWGWPYYGTYQTGYTYGVPGTGYDNIGSGAVGPGSTGAPGAVFLIY